MTWDFRTNIPQCTKHGTGDCLCSDCGSRSQCCNDKRCDDEKGLWDPVALKCYAQNADGSKGAEMEQKLYDYCYSNKRYCQPSACDTFWYPDEKPQYLAGCMRNSPGECKDCPEGAVKELPDKYKLYYLDKTCKAPNTILVCRGTRICYAPCKPCENRTFLAEECHEDKDNLCMPCPRFKNKYFPAYSGDQAWIQCTYEMFWKVCTPCTNTGDYAALLNDCPPFDKTMGFTSGDPATRQCLPCVACPERTYFINNHVQTGLTCVTDPARQCVTIPLAFNFTSQRVHGWRNPDIYNNLYGDTLPFYRQCDPPFPPGYVARGPTGSWDDDCDYKRVGRCAPGWYNRSGSGVCVQCPNDDGPGLSPGNARCVCAEGKALLEDIQKLGGGVTAGASYVEQTCYDCSSEVTMPTEERNMNYQERVVCLKNAGIWRCGFDEYVQNNACVACPVGSVPVASKDRCEACSRGDYYNVTQRRCVRCDGVKTYCPSRGMTVPLVKRTECLEAGQMLSINNRSDGDNECKPCPTSECAGHVLVYAGGHTEANACSMRLEDGSDVRFFACYPPSGEDVLPDMIKTGHRLRFQAGQVLVDRCEDGWLPPHAEWVDPHTEYPLGCVFACRYGWNQTLGAEVQTAIKDAIASKRQDLQEFWDGVLTGSKRMLMSLDRTFEKVLWPIKTNDMEYIPNQWAQLLATEVHASVIASDAYARQNTFLYMEEAGVPPGLCYGPEELKTTPCPLGYNISTTARTPCALLARGQGFYAMRFFNDSTDYYAVVDPDTLGIQCHVPQVNVRLHHWSSYGQCVACLDQLKEANPQQQWLRPMMGAKSWYAFTKPGVCSGMTCVGGSVALPSQQACVPCNARADEWLKICTPGVLDVQQCSSTGKLLTVDDVCVPCPGGGVLTTSHEIEQWEASRSGWAYTPCRYLCAPGYTSNLDEAQYNAGRPCVSCDDEVLPAFVANGTCGFAGGESYFDMGAQRQACRDKQYLPFAPSCVPCAPQVEGVRLVGRPFGMVSMLSECLGICDERQYFTLLKLNGSRVFSPVAQGDIWRCEPCGEEHLANCSNLTECVGGYFWNGSHCEECNTSACNTAPGLYRTECGQGSYADSTCGACDEGRLLYNNNAQEIQPQSRRSVEEAFNASQLGMSRRWAPLTYNRSHLGQSVFRSAEGCFVTCANNYAWVDLATLKPPSSSAGAVLRSSFACLPCSSAFMGGGGQKKYSVWNYSRGGGVYGGCYTCPPRTDTIAEQDVMCQSPAGYGHPIGTPVNVTVIVGASDVGVSGSVPNVTVPSLRWPYIHHSSEVFFQCCNEDLECKLFTKLELDLNQASVGPGSAYAACKAQEQAIGWRRRRQLLQQQQQLSTGEEEGVQACWISQYNTKRGDNTCYDCPEGSSTPPSEGATSKRQCVCLAGYYRPSPKAVACLPCGLNWHRTVYMNESACERCPEGMMTPSATSANCFCSPGLYLGPSGECVVCRAGSYCEGGSRVVQCPLNSMSPPGAKTRSDCVCDPAKYYGSLAVPGSECMLRPFAQKCDPSSAENSSSSSSSGQCSCAQGWRPVVVYGSTMLRCVAECALGEYARVDPVTFKVLECVACPLHTYSSSRQMVEVVGRGPEQQCTPCPLNLETTGVGRTSALECVCRRGVTNASDSTSCGLCAAGSYLDELRDACSACPPGSTSPAGSIGVVACMCPSGSRLKSASVCEPCPRNTYSSSAGLSCTPCPWPMVTVGEGSKSLAECVCPEGYYQHAGRCVAV